MNKYIDNKIEERSRFDRLLRFIPEGKENAVSMIELSRIFRISDRDLRKWITNSRKAGYIIAGDHNGYYIPADRRELFTYYRTMERRISTCLASLEAVKDKLKEGGGESDEI